MKALASILIVTKMSYICVMIPVNVKEIKVNGLRFKNSVVEYCKRHRTGNRLMTISNIPNPTFYFDRC